MITATAKKWCGVAGVQSIPDLFVHELWASRRGVCWESKPSPPLDGTVYNGTTDGCTRIDNLYPTLVLTRVNLPEVMVTVAGTTIGRQFFRCISACALPVLPCARLLLVSSCDASGNSGLTEADRAVACATVSNDTQSLLCTLMHLDHERTPRFKSHTVVSFHHTVTFTTRLCTVAEHSF